MGYKVLKHFRDLQDDGYVYHEGDTFPRDGLSVSEERIFELASSRNKRGTPLIEIPIKADEPSEEPAPKETPKKSPGKSSKGKKKG